MKSILVNAIYHICVCVCIIRYGSYSVNYDVNELYVQYNVGETLGQSFTQFVCESLSVVFTISVTWFELASGIFPGIDAIGIQYGVT